MKSLLILMLVLLPAVAYAIDAGFPLPDEYAKRASEGIEKYRKSDAVIRVMNDRGEYLPDARVEAHQVSHDFLFGCAFPSWDISKGQPNPETLAKFEKHFLTLFNYTTPENMLKWKPMERVEGQPDYHMIDAYVDWCIKNHITIKGHTLAWGHDQGHPGWLDSHSPDEVSKLTEKHIRDVVGRYKGKVDIWDVVNEPMDQHWFEGHMSPYYAVKSLKWAREANPKATLIVNEYSCHFDDKAERFTALCKRYMDNGAPIDALGEQAHDPPRIMSPKRMYDTLDELASLGKDVHLTEITYPSNGAEINSDFVKGKWTPEIQAKYYRYYYTLAFSHPKVKAITLWAMWDGSSWLKEGGIIAKDWQPKPAYHELDSLINKEWRTNASGSTSLNGDYRFRGFHGNYEVKVTAGGKTKTAKLHIADGNNNTLLVRML